MPHGKHKTPPAALTQRRKNALERLAAHIKADQDFLAKNPNSASTKKSLERMESEAYALQRRITAAVVS